MVRYLKYIVIIFSIIGFTAASFFFLQNKHDISQAWKYRSQIDYDYLNQNCPEKDGDYIYPCLKKEYAKFLESVSLTGTSMGLKMVFTVMDDDKDHTTKFATEQIKQMHFSINYIEVNSMALNNAYRRYFGFENLYGGFVSSLNRYYEKGFEFSQNLILGLEGKDGILLVKDPKEYQLLRERLLQAKSEFYKIKEEVEAHVDSELSRLTAEQK